MSNVIEIIDRIKEITNLKEDKEVATILSMTQANLSRSKSRNSIPYKHIMRYCQDHAINTNWVFFGHGGMYLSDCSEHNASRSKDLIRQILDVVKDLPEHSIQRLYHLAELERLEQHRS